MAEDYWFGCTMTFDCPAWGRSSVEKTLCASPGDNSELISQRLSRGKLKCQICGELIGAGVETHLDVRLGTLDDLLALGFSQPTCDHPLAKAAHPPW
jgi:hypothetical protein